MSKEDMINFTGKVTEALPNAMFKVQIPTKTGNMDVLCSVNGRMRKNNITVLVDDSVDIEMTPYDVKRGRIIFRRKV